MTEYRFEVDAAGLRLDKYVGERCPELSRTHAQKLIAAGFITVNGRAARSSLKLERGDQVYFVIPPEPSCRLPS